MEKTLNDLLRKYNVSYSRGHNGIYNDNNGSNCHAQELMDARKFKKKIADIIRAEFPGVKFKISASFAGWCARADVVFFLCRDAFKTFGEVERDAARNGICSDILTKAHHFQYKGRFANGGSFGQQEIRAYYERVIVPRGEVEFLRPYFADMVEFVEKLLESYSYDHSDPMADYFDAGLSFSVSVCTGERKAAEETISRLNDAETSADAMAILGPVAELTEEEKEAIAEAEREHREEVRRKEEEESRRREEEAKREREESARFAAACEAADVVDLDRPEDVEAVFSGLNKPANLDEARELVRDCPREIVARVVRVVTFRTAEDYDRWAARTIADTPRLYDRKKGGYLGGSMYVNADGSDVDDETAERIFSGTEDLGTRRQLWECVKVGASGRDWVLVDPEGFGYARYIGFAK